MKRLLLIFVLVVAGTAHASSTYFIRSDGGTRYQATNVPTGQCDGLGDAAYPGTGVNQHCAFKDVRYMWDDGSYGNYGWLIVGGDTIVIRSCHAAGDQQNPSNPNCRVGYDTSTGGGSAGWCAGTNPNYNCGMPTIPAGTSVAHTRILGGCAYGTYTCNSGNASTRANLTVLFGGFGLGTVFNLTGTQYVDVEGLEITTHNGTCTDYGSPANNHGCSHDSPADDYAKEGIATDAAMTNVLLQDVWVDGFDKGIHGPLGANITLTRVNSNFNGFAGWDMDNGGASNGPNASLFQTDVTMIGNGCYQEWPIVHPAFPARACYDTNDAGFGDSWSGQSCDTSDPNCAFATVTCDRCTIAYNTKDGFFGPHTLIKNLSLTNSSWYGNMGSQLKWGTQANGSTVFENNFVDGNCFAMSQQIPGAGQNFNQSTGLTGSYLSNWCRAAGAPFAINSSPNSTFLFAGNTIFSNVAPTTLQMSCASGLCASTIWQFTDNIFRGYHVPDGYGPFGPFGYDPAVYYTDDPVAGDLVVHSDHNLFFGGRTNDCAGGTGGVALTSTAPLCADPRLIGQPTSYSSESVFYPLIPTTANLYPNTDSAAIHAGVLVTGLTADFYAVARPNPPTIGFAEPSGGTPTAPSPTYSPVAGTYAGTQSVTLSTTSVGPIICYNTVGSPATNGTTGCTTGTLYSGPISVAASETVYSVAGGTGWLDSTVASAAYVITTANVATPTFSPVAGTYVGTQTVTLATSTGGASIIYTTDGTAPTVTALTCTITNGTIYTGALTVSTSQTLKAIGCLSGDNASSVGTAAYVINPAATPTFSPVAGSYIGTTAVTLSTATTACSSFMVWNTTNAQTGGNLTGTTSGSAVSVVASETVYAQIQGCTGVANSAIGSAAYVISAPTPPNNLWEGIGNATGILIFQ